MINLKINNNGYFYFGVGSLFMVLVVGFIVINITAPNFGGEIVSSLRSLFSAVRR